jgi:hypothetical protein
MSQTRNEVTYSHMYDIMETAIMNSDYKNILKDLNKRQQSILIDYFIFSPTIFGLMIADLNKRSKKLIRRVKKEIKAKKLLQQSK